jgi:hypothetical protein
MPILLFVHRFSGVQHNARLCEFLRQRLGSVIVCVNEVSENVVSCCPDECGEYTLITNATVAPYPVHTQKGSKQSCATGYSVRQQEAIGLVRIDIYAGVDVDWNSVLSSHSSIHTSFVISLRREGEVGV